MTDPRPEWKSLSFRDDETPAPAAPALRAGFIRQRAKERFNLTDADFNPADTPSFPGTMPMRNILSGGIDAHNVYELQISKAAAERLRFEYHPEILALGDIVERPRPPLGVPVPPKWPKGPKIG